MDSFELVADGLGFPEGPVALSDGSLLVVEIRSQCVTRIAADGSRRIIASLAGGPNGAAIGPDGAIYVCNNGGFAFGEVELYAINIPVGPAPDYAGGSIQRIDPVTSEIRTLYTEAGDVPLRGPNDLVFDRRGGFWFTDHGKSGHRDRDRVGVFYAAADGSFIREVIFPLENPNGIGLSPDGRTLYVAETYTCQLWAFSPSTASVPVRPSGISGGFSGDCAVKPSALASPSGRSTTAWHCPQTMLRVCDSLGSSGEPQFGQAMDRPLNFASATASPGLWSGCIERASLR